MWWVIIQSCCSPLLDLKGSRLDSHSRYKALHRHGSLTQFHSYEYITSIAELVIKQQRIILAVISRLVWFTIWGPGNGEFLGAFSQTYSCVTASHPLHSQTSQCTTRACCTNRHPASHRSPMLEGPVSLGGKRDDSRPLTDQGKAIGKGKGGG